MTVSVMNIHPALSVRPSGDGMVSALLLDSLPDFLKTLD